MKTTIEVGDTVRHSTLGTVGVVEYVCPHFVRVRYSDGPAGVSQEAPETVAKYVNQVRDADGVARPLSRAIRVF